MLELRDVYGGYGDGLVLNGLSLTVDEGQVVALLGRNGAGKTTTMRAVFGLLPRLAGTITLRGSRSGGWRPTPWRPAAWRWCRRGGGSSPR
jgi:ABC-type branched-subunit amino acid transport system ATPase component